MVVYIEYALLENFLYDCVLLRLAFFASREKTKWLKIALSALLGSVFAVLCPFIVLPSALFLLLKIGVGALLCMLCFGRLKTKKEWGRYAFTVLCFYFLTFGYGGALLSFSHGKGATPQRVFVGFFCVSAGAIICIQKLYQKRALHAFIYPCTLSAGQNSVAVSGYYDSGNTATKNGMPICFVSPDALYALFGEQWLTDGGTGRDETEIRTLSGVQKVTLYQGEITVKTPRGEIAKSGVYFAPSKNMITREYKVLLHAGILGD